MKEKIKIWWLLLLCIWLMCTGSGMAATKKGFVTTKSGNTVYYRNGKKVKGFQKIKKKNYYFDSKGILVKNKWIYADSCKYRTDEKGGIITGWWTNKSGKTFYMDRSGKVQYGWQNINGKYYFFHAGTGVMFKNRVVDGIRLNKKGAASKRNEKALLIYTLAQKVVDEITNSDMTGEEKLRTCFEWVVAKKYRTVRYPFKEYEGWAYDYAGDIFIGGSGTCFSDAAAFGFLANALRYEDVCVSSSGGHGWTEIDGMVYDPLLYEDKKDERYYGQIRAGGHFKAYYQVKIP